MSVDKYDFGSWPPRLTLGTVVYTPFSVGDGDKIPLTLDPFGRLRVSLDNASVTLNVDEAVFGYVGLEDASGHQLVVNPDGSLNVSASISSVAITSSALPTGASTSANQATGNTSLAAINNDTTAAKGALGTPTDPKNVATDGTPATHTALLKQISFTLQNPPGGGGAVSLANGASVALGSTTDNKSLVTDGTAATEIALLKGISYTLQNPAAVVLGASTVVIGHVIVDSLDATSAAALANLAGIKTGTDHLAAIQTDLDEIALDTDHLAGIQTDLDGIAITQATAALQTAGNTTLSNLLTALDELLLPQGSTSVGQVGPLVQGVVSDNPNPQIDGVIAPLSLTNDGRLRVSVAPGEVAYFDQDEFNPAAWQHAPTYLGGSLSYF